MRRYVTLGSGRRVTIASYFRMVRAARLAPEAQHRLDGRVVDGADVVRQYRRNMHERISQAVPYCRRGGH